MTSAPDLVRELHEAVERQDWNALRQRMHPDVVWRHNIGVGSPEEGEYEGRESVIALYERIVEPWDYIRTVASEVRDLGGGVVMVKGELHAKHSATPTELVTPYAQRMELQDGLLARGEMVTGPGASLPEPEPQ